jgi:hypothetical protein
MGTQRLGQRQLFNMLRGNLEKRVLKFYSETKEVSTIIEYMVAILVRHALALEDFSLMCQELIRELFFTAKPCAEMRAFSAFLNIILTKRSGIPWSLVCIGMKRIILIRRRTRVYIDSIYKKKTRRGQMNWRIISLFFARSSKVKMAGSIRGR